jgi:hypothetical protein
MQLVCVARTQRKGYIKSVTEESTTELANASIKA